MQDLNRRRVSEDRNHQVHKGIPLLLQSECRWIFNNQASDCSQHSDSRFSKNFCFATQTVIDHILPERSRLLQEGPPLFPSIWQAWHDLQILNFFFNWDNNKSTLHSLHGTISRGIAVDQDNTEYLGSSIAQHQQQKRKHLQSTDSNSVHFNHTLDQRRDTSFTSVKLLQNNSSRVLDRPHDDPNYGRDTDNSMQTLSWLSVKAAPTHKDDIKTRWCNHSAINDKILRHDKYLSTHEALFALLLKKRKVDHHG